MRRSFEHVGRLAGVALGVAVIAGLLVHVYAAASPTPRAVATQVVAATVKPAVVGTASPALRRGAAPTVTPAPAMPTALAPGEAVSALPDAGSTPSATPAGTAWITLDSYASTPGSRTVLVRGGGFASGETLDVRADGAGSRAHATLVADAAGNVAGGVPVQIAPGAGATVRFVVDGERSGQRAMATIDIVPYVAILSLTPYAASPGQPVDVFGQGFPPNAPVHLQVGDTTIRTAHADGGGNVRIQGAFTVPYTALAGHLQIAVISSVGRVGASQVLNVLPLQPWATASSYAVHAGDHVQFDAHGFAVGEPVKVYVGESYLGQSSGITDGQGNVAGLGPFAVPSGDPQPIYTLVGARSNARVEVRLTIVIS
ncbi:MAG TPA: hypothetical protein VHB98_16100 [Chloroflexota bacterium]|nr:hypothetical protein [Chloroflexota bacterium]